MREVRGEHLYKAYAGAAVLEDVSFTLAPGVTCLMAPSGRGKTTLLRLLLGLEPPDRGGIYGLEGLRPAVVFQEDRLLEGLSALENVSFVVGRRQRTQAAELLTGLGLDPAEKKPVAAYSGGMRRRVALARALAAPFDMLLLDEPFTGLDQESRQKAADCVRAYGSGKIVLLVTHRAEEVQTLGGTLWTL